MNKQTSKTLHAQRVRHGDDNSKIITSLVTGNTGASTICLQPVYDDKGVANGMAVICDFPPEEVGAADKSIGMVAGMGIMARDFVNSMTVALSTHDKEMIKIIMEFHEGLKEYLEDKLAAAKGEVM